MEGEGDDYHGVECYGMCPDCNASTVEELNPFFSPSLCLNQVNQFPKGLRYSEEQTHRHALWYCPAGRQVKIPRNWERFTYYMAGVSWVLEQGTGRIMHHHLCPQTTSS